MVAGNIERRSVGAIGRMGIVAGMHVAVFFLVARSLGIIPVAPPPADPIDTRIIPETRPPVDERRPIDPPLEPSLVPRLPEPVLPPLDLTLDGGITAELVPPDDIDIGETGSAVVIPAIVGPRQDARHPLSQPPYPARDIREGNEGNADVEVYVLANGRVGDARIAKSSGFERLDRSAIEEAKRNWKLIPATQGGQPVAQWYKVRVTFKLTNQ
jgi:periplasmic protein TonB